MISYRQPHAGLLGRTLTLAVAGFLLVAAHAGAVLCSGTVQEVHLWTTGSWEGAVGATVKGDFGTVVWILCSISADKSTAKRGQTLWAVHEMHAGTCESVLAQLTVAETRGTVVKLTFDDTVDPVFTSCTTVPQWGGELRGGTEDDSGRLGAWDAFIKLAANRN